MARAGDERVLDERRTVREFAEAMKKMLLAIAEAGANRGSQVRK